MSEIDIMKIMNVIPHRYPMLLLDKVLETDGTESATGLKNVTINEPYFVGHFPSYPVVPGVLLVESLAQLATVLVTSAHYLSEGGEMEWIPYFMSMEAKFRRPVVPGDTMILKIQKQRRVKDSWKYYGKILVEEEVRVEAKCIAAFVRNR